MRFGSWEAGRELGRGAMGVVYAARHADTGVRAALKSVLVDGRALADACAREIAALGQVSHPGIVALLDQGRDEDGRPWFAMEFVDGVPLPSGETASGTQDWADEVQDQGDRASAGVVELGTLRQLCEPLAALHAAGLVATGTSPLMARSTFNTTDDPQRWDSIDTTSPTTIASAMATATGSGSGAGDPSYTLPEGLMPTPRSPAAQVARLDAVPGLPAFDAHLGAAGCAPILGGAIAVFQVNLGKLCNMSCRHCHVDAGPHRVEENMDRATVDACLALLDRVGAPVVDVTGGAPELNPHFRYLVSECVARGKHVIDRCNLSVLLLPRSAGLAEFMAEHGVEIVASLPHWRRPNTDAQRGEGAYDRSIEALRRLNTLGYGAGDPRRRLTLMHNPAGAFLPGSGAAALEREWKDGLARTAGVAFDRLIALNNMPISRYLDWLDASGNLDDYMTKLVRQFNPAAVGGLMCRDTLSIGWDGAIYDCDFNQMLELRSADSRNIRDLDPGVLPGRRIRTARHCFGCTAGAGSSCGGATAPT